MPAPTLRQIQQARRAQVRARIKQLLSTHPHRDPARLSGAWLSLPAAPMRAATHAAVCRVAGVGGLFIQGGHVPTVGAVINAFNHNKF